MTNPGMPVQRQRVGLLRDLRAYLDYERNEGRTRITVSASGPSRRMPATPVPPPQSPPATAAQVCASPPVAAWAHDLETIAQAIAVCTCCALSQTRTRTVPGHGHPHPDLMFIGEAPGEQEDLQGLPFVGRSGKLLTRMLNRLGLSRDEVFIANILKCRPPANRDPTPAERDACRHFLEAQIELLRPKVIVALGSVALRGLLPDATGLSHSRGTWLSYRGIPLMPTYHPAYLLRNPKARFITWDDMLKVLERLGRQPPAPTE